VLVPVTETRWRFLGWAPPLLLLLLLLLLLAAIGHQG
jgi:hypothetical protein